MNTNCIDIANLNVHSASKDDFPKLVEFNKVIYPDKKISSADYLDFWFKRDGNAISQCLVLKDINGDIYGQILASEMTYFYNNQKIQTVWLFDLIVKEELRKSSWGVDLLIACMNKHPRSCSTGSGPTALPIHLKMGNKRLGDIRKYIGITNHLNLFTSIFRGTIKNNKYPISVKIKDVEFKKVDSQDFPNLENSFNPDLFEIARDKDFIQWRFFSNFHEYVVYKSCLSNDYFVLRTIVKKHSTAMVLVDYRCDMTNSDSFDNIFQAVTKIMNKLHLGILITGSSLNVVDQVLEFHKLKSIGRPRPVIGFVKQKDRKQDVESRNFILATLADSDGETNWI